MGIYSQYNEDQLSNIVIGVDIDIQSQIGLGLLENVYKQVLYHKLIKAGIEVEMKKNMPILINDLYLDLGYKIDLLVENKLILELKSVKEISNIHVAQVLNYLKTGKFQLELILNFNVYQLKTGIRRVILTDGPGTF